MTVYTYTSEKDDDGNIIKTQVQKTFNGSSMPADPSRFATLAPGFYQAVRHKHLGKYWALQIRTFETENNGRIPVVGGKNPNTGLSYATGANIHKAGRNNYTGTFWANTKYSVSKWGFKTSKEFAGTYSGVSEACQLVDVNKWNDFYSHFPKGVGNIGVILSRSAYTVPVLKNPTNPDLDAIELWRQSGSNEALMEKVRQSFKKK